MGKRGSTSGSRNPSFPRKRESISFLIPNFQPLNISTFERCVSSPILKMSAKYIIIMQMSKERNDKDTTIQELKQLVEK